VTALGGRPLPGDLPGMPGGLGDFPAGALPGLLGDLAPLGGRPLGEPPERGDLDLGLPTLPLGLMGKEGTGEISSEGFCSSADEPCVGDAAMVGSSFAGEERAGEPW
jgi:hypothetical protein